MFASSINLTIFIMMIIIYLNELKNVSMFIFNFNYIKDMSKIIMEEKCNNIYCEAETDRYQIAKNSYKLLLSNDIFNSKTYIIMIFIISIMIYIYYYYLLFDSDENNKAYYILHLILLTILVSMIILRYAPHDEAGYKNYFRDYNDPNNYFAKFIIFFTNFTYYSVYLGIPLIIIYIKKDDFKNFTSAFPTIIKGLCYILSLILIFNLMNIVMTFRTNTKPILKTKKLSWSLQKSFEKLNKDIIDNRRTELDNEIPDEMAIFKDLITNIEVLYCKQIEDSVTTKESTTSYIINIFIAFNELVKITLNNIDGLNLNDNDKNYINSLKTTIKKNHENLQRERELLNNTLVSNVSLIYDKTVKLPFTYNYLEDTIKSQSYKNEHYTNGNKNNADYIYTADISYDSPNLFYEKYWDINEVSLWNYDYFVPTILFNSKRPNLYNILVMVISVIVFIVIIHFFARGIIGEGITYNIYTVLQPLIMFVILIIFILLFIYFNTWFNKYVVYMCLDSSYKRSLNKLNSIVIPYIRMYDNKIIRGNKTYIRHYIIANVFYSILTGNIKLNENTGATNAFLTSAQLAAQTKEINAKNAYNAAKTANEKIFALNAILPKIINSDPKDTVEQFRLGKSLVMDVYTTTADAETKANLAYDNSGDSATIKTFKTALTNFASKIQDISITNITTSSLLEAKLADISPIISGIVTTEIAALNLAQNALGPNELSDEKIYYVNNAKRSVNELKIEIDKIKVGGPNAGYTYDVKKVTITKYVGYAKREVANAKNIIVTEFSTITSAKSLKDFVNTTGGDYNIALTAFYRGLSDLATIKTVSIAAYTQTKKAKTLSDAALKDAELAQNAVIQLISDYSTLNPIDIDEKKDVNNQDTYYDISRIKTGRLKFANMNNSILSNDNEFREYYKSLYKNIYKETYDATQADKLYNVFKNIFTSPATDIKTIGELETYFKTNIITNDTTGKIYLIIKKCIELFDEEKFNNNLIYYNNPDSIQKGIDISAYNKFKFFKYGDNIIPYKFILKLNTTSEYEMFVKDIKVTTIKDFNDNLSDYFGITAPETGQPHDITPILQDNDEEDLLSQASDIEKKQDKNLIKIIAKYLLILGHINYNRIEYSLDSSNTDKKKEIYERKSYYLYRLFSNILYDDTYDIDDTFKTALNEELLIVNTKYKNLTYIYNYLETKYVVISPSNNKNYLINIIKSINNKINDDDKILNNDAKNARYLFRDKINNKNNPEEYDNEEDILNYANNISTRGFAAIYFANIIIGCLYFYIISINLKKSF